MSTESLNRTSDITETPSQISKNSNILELDVLKQEKKLFNQLLELKNLTQKE